MPHSDKNNWAADLLRPLASFRLRMSCVDHPRPCPEGLLGRLREASLTSKAIPETQPNLTRNLNPASTAWATSKKNLVRSAMRCSALLDPAHIFRCYRLLLRPKRTWIRLYRFSFVEDCVSLLSRATSSAVFAHSNGSRSFGRVKLLLPTILTLLRQALNALFVGHAANWTETAATSAEHKANCF